MIIAVLGENASGKTTFSDFVKQEYGYDVYEIGNYVRHEYAKTDKSLTLLDFANLFYKKGKLHFFILKAISESKTKNSKKIIFSGLRTLYELKCLQNAYPDIKVIQIKCSYEKRCKRYFKFGIDNIKFEERDRVEREWIGGELKNAKIDYVIDNSSTIELFYKNIKKMFF